MNLCSNDFFILGKRRRVFQLYFVWGEINKMPMNEHAYSKQFPETGTSDFSDVGLTSVLQGTYHAPEAESPCGVSSAPWSHPWCSLTCPVQSLGPRGLKQPCSCVLNRGLSPPSNHQISSFTFIIACGPDNQSIDCVTSCIFSMKKCDPRQPSKQSISAQM